MGTVPRVEAINPRSARLSAWLDREDVLGYLLVLPVVLIVIGFLAYPFYLALSTSLTDKVIGGAPHFIGLKNYETIWQDVTYRQAIRNTLTFTAAPIAIELPLA